MTDLSNTPPDPENDNDNPESPTSPRVMLITMILLISGLALSSVMFLNYAMDGREEGDQTMASAFAKLMEKGKALIPEPEPMKNPKPLEEEPLETTEIASGSSMMRFFSSEKPTVVRWPKLKLTGFGKGYNGQSDFAIINNEQILVGTPIDEVMLIEVLTQGVVVEYKGERKTLNVKVAQ